MAKDFEKILLSILGWFFGIILILASFGNFTEHSLIAGTIFLIISLFVLPPSRKFFKEKLNFDLSRGIEIIFMYIKNKGVFRAKEKNKSKENRLKNILPSDQDYSNLKNTVFSTSKSSWIIIGIIILVIIGMFSSNSGTPTTKKGAYYHCLKKAGDCSQIPAEKLELMSACKDIYMYTDEQEGLEKLNKLSMEMC